MHIYIYVIYNIIIAPPWRTNRVVACNKNACTLSLAGSVTEGIIVVMVKSRSLTDWMPVAIRASSKLPTLGIAGAKPRNSPHLVPGNVRHLQSRQAKVTCCRALDDIVEDCCISIHSQDSPENRILPVGFDASAKATFAWSKYAENRLGVDGCLNIMCIYIYVSNYVYI